MIARHFRPQPGDCFVSMDGLHLQVEEVGKDHVRVYSRGVFTWSKTWNRIAVQRAVARPVWFYTREGGAGLL